MTCVSPPELDDRELLTYIDAEAEPQVVAHLEQCEHCREKAHRLAHLQERLTNQLYRLTCPAPAELGEYHLDLLPPDRFAEVTSHLIDCPHCTQEMAQLKDFLGELTPDLAFSPLRRIRVLVAQLMGRASEMGMPGSPAPAPAYAGLRGEDEGPYVYQADGAQIIVEIQDDAGGQDRKVLLGLVTGVDPQALQVHLWEADQLVTTATVDELGTFVIPNLAPGTYELMLSGPEMEIHIQALTI
jgi:anti-sigma factor RsiW